MKASVSWLALALVLCLPPATAQQLPNLQGVYQSISAAATLPDGRRNQGAPRDIELLPEASRQARTADLKKDPWKICQPVGPFRMMSAGQVKIELVPVSAIIVMLFEDLSHGMMRTIYLKRGHPAKLEPTWLGDSVGHREGPALVVDTTGFNDRTWLNELGAPHSDALHVVERIRPVLGGRYLQYEVTAEDARTLARPYTYTRYFQKTNTEIMDDPCQDAE